MVSEMLPTAESLELFAKNHKSIQKSNACKGSFNYDVTIDRNTNNLSQYLNVSDMTTDQKVVSNQSIQLGTELFLHLNACPKSKESFTKYWSTFYTYIFAGKISNVSPQQIVLSLLKMIKDKKSKDGQDIANIILARLSKDLGFRYYIPEVSRKGIFGRNIDWKSSIINITGNG